MKLHAEGLHFRPTIGFSTMTVLQLTSHPLTGKRFWAQKLIAEMEHQPCSPDLAPNDFWLFPKIKSALKGRRLQDIKNV